MLPSKMEELNLENIQIKCDVEKALENIGEHS